MTELNAEQRAAVESESRSVFIQAGAGSGKTRVLTERYAAAVREHGSSALDSVLTITFTDKAAGELAERVRRRLASQPGCEDLARQVERAWISTIHGMCSRLLHRHPLELGIDPTFAVGGEVELGVLRGNAYEAAALKALDGGGGLAELVMTFRPAELMSAVTGASERIRSMGARPADVLTACVDLGELHVLVDSLESVAQRYAQLPEGKTVDANRASLRALQSACADFFADRVSALELAGLATAFSQKRTGGEELKTLAAEADAIVARIALAVAQLAVGPFEVAMLRLLEMYADEYEAEKAASGLLDFEDLQGLAATLLESVPGVAERYAQQFRQVMVDEFQDTNPSQVALVRKIAPDGFVTVGDEKQSIYRFRHADVGVFRERAKQAEVTLALTTNYRSHPALLEFFNEAFSRPPFWPESFLRLTSGAAEEEAGPRAPRVSAVFVDVSLCGDDKAADEAGVVARRIRELVDTGVSVGDIVILMRAMTKAETFAAALRAEGIEPFVASGGTYFDRPEVADLEMLLRVVANPLDCEALAHVLAGPLTGLSADAMALLRDAAGRGPLWPACREADTLGLSDRDAEALGRTVTGIRELRERGTGVGLADAIHDACETLEYDLTLFAQGRDGARAWANVLKLARIAEDFERRAPGDPKAFVDYLELKREHSAGESLAAFSVEGVDAVRIMSIHAAKGLEFPIVFAVGLGHRRTGTDPILVTRREGRPFLGMRLPAVAAQGRPAVETAGHAAAAADDAEESLDEEKRVFYVACTRAERELVLVGRTDFSKPAGADTAIDWLRESLGFTQPDSIQAGDLSFGGAVVRVLTPEPHVCEAADVDPEPVDEATRELLLTVPALASRPTTHDVPRISYSGLAEYRGCSYRFYVSRIARLGARIAPGEGGGPTAVGSAVHALLSLGDDSPSPERVAEVCAANGVKSEHYDRVAEAARAFYRSDLAREIAAAERVAREVPFAVPISDSYLDGAIDLIAWRGGNAIIVDYKTGVSLVDSPGEKYRGQADCYAIAALSMGAQAVSVHFVQVENDCRTDSFEYKAEDLAALRSSIEADLRSITEGAFEPLRKYDRAMCDGCAAYGSLCPVTGPHRPRAV